MRTPHKCPVCNGAGTISKLTCKITEKCLKIGYIPMMESIQLECKACQASGVLWENKEEGQIPITRDQLEKAYNIAQAYNIARYEVSPPSLHFQRMSKLLGFKE